MSIHKSVGLSDIITRKPILDSVDLEEEIVMMDIEKGKYYGFNSVGSRIWELIEKPLSVDNIISSLIKDFNVDYKICEDEVLKFINKLYAEELISFV